MLRLLLSVFVALAATLPYALAVRAHGAATAYIVVPADHVVPGQAFDVFVADMGPRTKITLTLETPQRTVTLATISAADDGHFQGSATLPSDYPEGYALLMASGSDGAQATIWVLVGRAGQGEGPALAAWWTDPSVIVLAVALGGALAGVGYLVLRPRLRPALGTVPARRRLPLKGKRLKSQRPDGR